MPSLTTCFNIEWKIHSKTYIYIENQQQQIHKLFLHDHQGKEIQHTLILKCVCVCVWISGYKVKVLLSLKKENERKKSNLAGKRVFYYHIDLANECVCVCTFKWMCIQI